MKYIPGDKVRITEPFDENYGMVGTILRYDNDDDSYLIEFEFDSPMFGPKSKSTTWYHGSSEFVYANKPSYAPKPFNWCNHEWREDRFFTKQVYKTCKKCGKKYEDDVEFDF